MSIRSHNTSKLRNLLTGTIVLSALLTGHASAGEAVDSPFPGLQNEIMVQGQTALNQLTRQQNRTTNWGALAVSTLSGHLEEQELETMFAAIPPCEQKKSQAVKAVESGPEPTSLNAAPAKAQS